MKKLLILLIWLIAGMSFAQSTSSYFSLGEKDSLGISEYMPKRYLEAMDINLSPKYLMISAGIYKDNKKNHFYGIYVDFDSALVHKDTLLAIVTTKGSYLLRECKSSREMNAPYTSIFVPDINSEYFYDFISQGEVVRISYSGTYFDVTNNNKYFSETFKEIKVKPNYFE